ncbi:hypothetical protein [Methylocapsa palsarum]|uniref:Uncharacterized protein n=1 Tax=Methylocapsa palsarum TaxID=1612308 RepID=A0A1I4BKE8_9HYPH|nr:hypothetical protein [Methylocapsa palsarum]SFK69248.1 hypothetical protein SAMN05444581_11569 [Methylocapsa palsarum]
MELENALYAGAQILHNFGAAAIVGLPLAALWFGRSQPTALPIMAWLLFAAWLLQTASGAGFGAVSYFMEGEFPEIHHIARAALIVKLICAFGALALLTAYFVKSSLKEPGVAIWRSLSLLGLTALTAAALLRWFS